MSSLSSLAHLGDNSQIPIEIQVHVYISLQSPIIKYVWVAHKGMSMSKGSNEIKKY